MTRITSMPVALVISAFLVAVPAGSSRAVEVADLPSASGGTQHVWYDAPAKPTAVAIMFIGGDGVVPFEADGSLKGGRSTLVRTRQLWLDHGVAVLIPGKPSSLVGVFSYRLSDTYAQDIRALVDFARAHASVPVWLFGHSLGTVAVASGASHLTHGEIAGAVFASPTVNRFPPRITETVFDAPLDVINVPALVAAHAQDSCSTTAPEGPARLRAAMTGSPKSDIFLFNGGEPTGGPCDPTALHSFVGLDAEFVERVAAWMAGSAFAADLPKEGRYDVTACFKKNVTRVDYSDTHYAWSYEEIGTSHSNPPGGLFDDEVVKCVGSTGSFDGKRTGSAVCVGVAKNGDKRLTRFYYGDHGKVNREAVSGTGTYDGMVTKGTIEYPPPQPEIKTGPAEYCNHQTGTYKLK